MKFLMGESVGDFGIAISVFRYRFREKRYREQFALCARKMLYGAGLWKFGERLRSRSAEARSIALEGLTAIVF